jgi:hypothetical protein
VAVQVLDTGVAKDIGKGEVVAGCFCHGESSWIRSLVERPP